MKNGKYFLKKKNLIGWYRSIFHLVNSMQMILPKITNNGEALSPFIVTVNPLYLQNLVLYV